MRDKILIIDDEKPFAESIKNLLRAEPFDIDLAHSGSMGIQKLRESDRPYAICVLDYNLPDMTGVDVARMIVRQNPHQEIIFMTADDSVETYKDMVGLGYTKRFVAKDDDPQKLKRVILNALESYNKLSRKFMGPQPSTSVIERDLETIGMVGRSKALHEIYRLIKKLKDTKGNILVLGSTGVGKELVASALNSTGNRFFPLNCASYGSGGENFLATQLFGHIKGAYTGADKEQVGVLERAHNGTVFLDEIHCMSPGSQRMLLRAVETKKVTRFGDTSNQGAQVDFRLICAGKPNIEDLITDDHFVKDLYYRIAEYVIRIPDLAERKEDIEPLVLHLLARINAESGKSIAIRGEAIRVLEDFSWPGNARDLRNALSQLVLDTPDGEITRVDAERYIAKRLKIQEVETHGSLSEQMETTEVETIKRTLRQVTSIRKAALLLQMPKSTLCHKIKKFNIDPERYLLTELNP